MSVLRVGIPLTLEPAEKEKEKQTVLIKKGFSRGGKEREKGKGKYMGRVMI